jgi:ankyrin repeat protein
MNIWLACQYGNLKEAQICIKNDASCVNARDSKGLPPLHWAALSGKSAVCSLLLENGACLETRAGPQQSTALHWAIW